MFRRPSGTFLFKLPWRTRLFGAIHTFFVSFPLQVVWLDKEMTVTDTVTARPWGIHWPKHSAAYIMETPADQPLPVMVGDRLRLEPC